MRYMHYTAWDFNSYVFGCVWGGFIFQDIDKVFLEIQANFLQTQWTRTINSLCFNSKEWIEN